MSHPGRHFLALAGLLAMAVLFPALPAEASGPPTRPVRPVPAPSFSFGAAGDHGSGPRAAAVLRRAGASGLGFFLSLGDLSYDTMPPQAWCQYVKDNLNAGAGRPRGAPYGQRFSFLLIEGNHDHASYGRYVAPSCLPPRLGAVPSPLGGYGREYYVDYPAAAPIARFIVTSPGVSFSYAAGSPHYRWLSRTIDDARRAVAGG